MVGIMLLCYSHYCYPFIGCTEGEVRLVNGNTENEGTIEICRHDLWGLISDSDWENSDAEVVCRQLGYSITSTFILFGSKFMYSHLMCMFYSYR